MIFRKQKQLVSIGADFLGDWQGGGFDRGYAKNQSTTEGTWKRTYVSAFSV